MSSNEWQPEDNSTPEDDRLLEAFLNRFRKKMGQKKQTDLDWDSDTDNRPPSHFFGRTDLRSLDPYNYKAANVPESMAQKVQRLQRISGEIEQKVVTIGEQLALFADKTFRIPYREHLNDAQYTAVTLTEGPVMVIAGAGSGKTRTLVYRTAFLLEQHVPAEQILLLTFTRKATKKLSAAPPNC